MPCDTGKWINKEVIDFEKIIGKEYINREWKEAKFGTVHYSKTGTHIVPNRKEDKR
ncbi:polymorphic toxin type 50 domain-containing protein [Staphylococcus delphini]|nr:polymorphic toxin type 50 domain-containing protein [Staphylococcus delphini]